MMPPARLAQLPPPPPGRTGWPWTEEIPSAAYARRQSWPRVSIVTPSFNQAAYLEETIRSVLLQNYPNLQYLVIDGGSSDGSREIIARYAPWLGHWESERDRGQSHAINKGLARCDGDWFNWLNSDDYLLPGGLAALAAAAAATPASIVAGTTRNLRNGRLAERYGCRLDPDLPAGLFSLGVNQPGSLLRLASLPSRSVCEALHYTMDLDLWLRVLLKQGGGVVAVGTDVAVYRYHDASKTCSANDVFALEEFAVLHDLLASLAPARPLPGLARVRGLCTAAPLNFAPDTGQDGDKAIAAFLDRLLVNDSLLFRALRRGRRGEDAAARDFLQLLEDLRPVMIERYGADHRQIAGRACLHAIEEIGRLRTGSLAWRAWRDAPSLSTIRALLRLCLPSRRSSQ